MLTILRRRPHSGLFVPVEHGDMVELDVRDWPKARVDRVLRTVERNQLWDEMGPDSSLREKVAAAVRRRLPIPNEFYRAARQRQRLVERRNPFAAGLFAMYKSRWDLSVGGMAGPGQGGGWEIDDMPIVDFGVNTSVAQNAFVRSGLNIFPLVNPFSALGSPDPHPFQDPGGTLTAIVGDRQVGSGRQGFVLCAGCFLVHSTGAGAVYQPAATATVNLRVQNNVTTVTGGLTTEATINVTTAANFIDQMPIVATTGRTLTTADGVARTNIFVIYDGDFCVGELANTNAAALNVQGNILFMMPELL